MSYESNVYDPSNKVKIEETLRGQATAIICVDICGIIIMEIASIAAISISGGSIVGVAIVIFIWLAMAGIIFWSYLYI